MGVRAACSRAGVLTPEIMTIVYTKIQYEDDQIQRRHFRFSLPEVEAGQEAGTLLVVKALPSAAGVQRISRVSLPELCHHFLRPRKRDAH